MLYLIAVAAGGWLLLLTLVVFFSITANFICWSGFLANILTADEFFWTVSSFGDVIGSFLIGTAGAGVVAFLSVVALETIGAVTFFYAGLVVMAFETFFIFSSCGLISCSFAFFFSTSLFLASFSIYYICFFISFSTFKLAFLVSNSSRLFFFNSSKVLISSIFLVFYFDFY